MDRSIACFEIPTLGIALARLADPSLNARPVALTPTPLSRGCLAEVSVEAQQDGVQPGLLIEEARRRCPALHVLPVDPTQIHHAEQDIVAIFARYAPVWEPVRPGQFFLDLTGTTRLFGPAADTSARIEREVARRCHLIGVAGTGTNKLVANVAATLIPPLQVYEVWPGSEGSFLEPLPLTVLPGFRRIHDRTVLERLEDLNLHTVGDVAVIPLSTLQVALGRWAVALHQWAQGIDPSPVHPPRLQPALEDSLTLDPDEIDDGRMRGTLTHLLERLCCKLRLQRRACARLTLVLRYSDGQLVSRSTALPCGTSWEVDLALPLTTLLHQCFQRRVRVRTLTLRADRLSPVTEQLGLFEADDAKSVRRGKAQRLAMALDQIRARHGDRAIRYGSTRCC